MRTFTTLVIITECCQIVLSARILGVFLAPSVSHQVVFQPIWKELSIRGHKVTVLTPNPLKDQSLTNLTEIDMGFAYETVVRLNLMERILKPTWLYDSFVAISDVMHDLNYAEISSSQVQDLLRDDTKEFDILLLEAFHPLVYGFAARYKVPFVEILSCGATLKMHDAIGNPTHPTLYPDMMVAGTSGSLFERIRATYGELLIRLLYNYWVMPKEDQAARELFGKDIPYLGDIERNASLMILNSNPIIYVPRPNVPAVVEIHQMHIKPKGALPKVSDPLSLYNPCSRFKGERGY